MEESGPATAPAAAAWTGNESTFFPQNSTTWHAPWERWPKSPFERSKTCRKVWKRYNLRPNHSYDRIPPTSTSDNLVNDSDPNVASPLRVVKKRRVVSRIHLGHDDARHLSRSSATKSDKRSSILPRRKMAREASAESLGSSETQEQSVSSVASDSEADLLQEHCEDQTAETSYQQARENLLQEITSISDHQEELEAPHSNLNTDSLPVDSEAQLEQNTLRDNFETEATHNSPILSPDMNSETLGETDEQDPSMELDPGLAGTYAAATENTASEPLGVAQSTASPQMNLSRAAEDDPTTTMIIDPTLFTLNSPAAPSDAITIVTIDEPASEAAPVNDISEGLTLTLPNLPAEEPEAIRLQAPKLDVPFEEGTTQLEMDTAMLKNFLIRAAASKASKSTTIARRTSESHRRDSGAVRQALSSPYRVLEDKDANSPSPIKPRTRTVAPGSRLKSPLHNGSADLTPPSKRGVAAEAGHEPNETPTSPATQTARRSSRRKTKIPQPHTQLPNAPLGSSVPPAQPAPNKIPVRRTDGSEPVVLRKTETQELALLTRTNTRRNKAGAVLPRLRLVKLAAGTARAGKGSTDESTSPPPTFANSEIQLPKVGERVVRWDEQLVYFELATSATIADPDESAVVENDANAPGKTKQTPQAKRLRSFRSTPMKPTAAPLASVGLMEKEAAKAISPRKTRVPRKVGAERRI